MPGRVSPYSFSRELGCLARVPRTPRSRGRQSSDTTESEDTAASSAAAAANIRHILLGEDSWSGMRSRIHVSMSCINNTIDIPILQAASFVIRFTGSILTALQK